MLSFEHASKAHHELSRRFSEWDESAFRSRRGARPRLTPLTSPSESSNTMHTFIFDMNEDAVLDHWPNVAERFGQGKRYAPCPKKLGETILLTDATVQSLMDNEVGAASGAGIANPKPSSRAERPKPRPSAGTANAVAPAHSATRSTAAPAILRRERSPQGQLRVSRAERSPSGGAKGAPDTRCSSDNEVQPGRRKILPEQEVQRLRYPDDPSVRGVAVFNTDIEKLCDGEFRECRQL